MVIVLAAVSMPRKQRTPRPAEEPPTAAAPDAAMPPVAEPAAEPPEPDPIPAPPDEPQAQPPAAPEAPSAASPPAIQPVVSRREVKLEPAAERWREDVTQALELADKGDDESLRRALQTLERVLFDARAVSPTAIFPLLESHAESVRERLAPPSDPTVTPDR
jgi:hypothetical protein